MDQTVDIIAELYVYNASLARACKLLSHKIFYVYDSNTLYKGYFWFISIILPLFWLPEKPQEYALP